MMRLEAETDPLIRHADRLIDLLERSGGSQTGDADAERMLGLALLRMRIRPALTGGDDPAHVVVAGGTNTGKSTIVNLLTGSDLAGMSAIARFSQHPIAFRTATVGDGFLNAHPSRFHGYERYANRPPPRQSDIELERDGYRSALAVVDRHDGHIPDAVIWDSPDFSSDAARHYLHAVLDVAAIADVLVLVVTAESYADERALRLTRWLGLSGRRIIVVANKFRSDGALSDDVRETLNANLDGVNYRLVVLPDVPGDRPADRLERLRETAPARSLLTEIETIAGDAIRHRGETLASAAAFLAARFDSIASVAVREAAFVREWESRCEELGRGVCDAYRREYLDRFSHQEFQLALARLSRLLEVPAVGPILRASGAVVRAPFRLARWAGDRLIGERAGPPSTESVLRRVFDEAFAVLRSQTQERAQRADDPHWKAVEQALSQPERHEAISRGFFTAYERAREALEPEIEARARAIYEELERRPRVLLALRSVNATIGLGAAAAVVAFHGINWADAVLAPIAAGIQQELLRHGLGAVVERQQQIMKRAHAERFREVVFASLVRPLSDLHGARVTPAALDEARASAAALSRALADPAHGKGVR